MNEAVVRSAVEALRGGAAGGGAAVEFDGPVPLYARLLMPVLVRLFRAAGLAAAGVRDARWKSAVQRYMNEARKPIAPLERQLTQKGFPTWATQAGNLAADFQRYLDQLAPQLGVANGSPGSAPQPSPPAPSPSA